MHGILLTIHLILCVLMVLVVLIQSGRSGGFSGLFGGGGGDALFSTSSQQSGMRNATVVIAALFMLTCLGLTMLSSRRGVDSVFNRALPTVPPVNVPQAPPAAPVDAVPVSQPK